MCKLVDTREVHLINQGSLKRVFSSYFSRKFIFNSLDQLWTNIENFFEVKKNIFSDLYPDEFLNELDPFRDGKAALRIADYMKDLMEGFNKGLDKKDTLLISNSNYKHKWGEDKIKELNYN